MSTGNIKGRRFLLVGNIPNNVYIQRKLRSWTFWILKIFLILMPFCNQNGKCVKSWILGFLRSEHKKLAREWMRATYLPLLKSERVYICKNRKKYFLCFFASKTVFFDFFWASSKFFKVKKSKISIFSKSALKWSKYRI